MASSRYKNLLLPILAILIAQASSAQLPGQQRRALSIGEAFPFFVSIVDNQTLTVTFQPAPEHYLYQHRFGFAMRGSDGASRALDYSLPDGLEKTDQFFGDIVAYYDSVTATVPVAASNALDGQTLIIEFQGCADWGLCYPPQVVEFPFSP